MTLELLEKTPFLLSLACVSARGREEDGGRLRQRRQRGQQEAGERSKVRPGTGLFASVQCFCLNQKNTIFSLVLFLEFDSLLRKTKSIF